jgi:hypothetical protein
MGLTDRAVNALRSVFGREREAREAAESPSTHAAMNQPQSNVLSDSKYGQFTGLLSVSNRLIDRYLDYECLTGDTHILTLNGPRSIQSLAEESRKDSSFRFPLYTWDGEKITLGYGQDARLVKRAKVYRVLLDDGTAIRATGNHKFMRRDGSYAETLDLASGDSLMPLYLSTDHYGNNCYSENNEYHLGALTKADKYRKRRTARMVAEWMTGERIKAGLRVVHIGARTDDSPENIKINDVPGLINMTMASPLMQALQEAGEVIKENCIAEGQIIFVKTGSVVTPVPIEQFAIGDYGDTIIGFDQKENALKGVEAISPRLTGTKKEVYLGPLSNGMSLRLTPDHRCLTVSRGYVAFKDLEAGEKLWSLAPNYPVKSASILTSPTPGEVTVLEKPIPDGVSRVFDVTTETKNMVVAGAVVHNSLLTFPPLKPWKNHKVVEVTELGEEDVYCLDVPGTHNYAIGDEDGGVFTHNSMDEYPDINTANHYFANDATQPNIDNDRTVWVDSSNHVVKGVANTLLKKKLRLDDDLFSIAYSLVKYGNNFEELLVTENGVVGLNYLPPATVRRIEHENGALVGFVQDPTGAFTDDMGQLRSMLGGATEMPKHLALFEDWQVSHARLRSTHRRSPYGYANCDGARWIWKRLIMLEDATMIYKLTRAPSRFAFYIDVTDQPSRKINGIMRQAKSQLKKRQIVDPRSGQINLQTNLLASDEDFYLPVRDGKELARVENLQGPEYQCLTGETKIPLLNGSEITIKEMAESGKEQWVYSCTEEGEFKPGLARSPRMTSPRERVWEVTLDNGEVVRCTWNHPFLTRDGRWVKAQDLSSGESLMPLNRRISSRKEHSDRLNGYEMLYNPIEGKFRTVVSVKETDDYEAVYDLTVEGTHCFGLSAGIFVHNSMEPVEYFQRKLHAVLKIPREYLGQEGAVPGRAILSNEDVRAARVTLNIQKELRNQVDKIIRVDAAARSVNDPWRLDFEVRMTMPSGIYALAQYEVKNSQADFASRVEPYVSKDWIRRNVFKLSDDEINAIEKGAEKDMQAQGGGGFGGGFGASVETDLTSLLSENIPEKVRGDIPTRHEINKMLDHMRRGEDKRRRKSDKRHDQLLEKLDLVMRTNAHFADKVLSRVDLTRLVKDNGLTSNRYGTHAVPSGRGRGVRISGAT